MTDVIDPVEPYESTEDPRNLPWHLERIAQRDYCGVNEGYWILRDAATALRKHAAAEAAGMVWVKRESNGVSARAVCASPHRQRRGWLTHE